MSKAAVMGLGTVGTGVVRLIAENAEQIEHRLGEPLEVKTVLVRHFKDGPYRPLMTDNFSEIENDPEIRVVVETIGGVGAAYEYTRRALAAGKHVVTANKQLVAEKGCELLALARKNKVQYLFEASVGGGIPILHPLTRCLSANRIEEIYGILNGTTNYILTRMVQTGADFSDALREAQEKGYAEADPAADVQGTDACRKICILSDLAFGREVPPEFVPTEGITGISLCDVKTASAAGYRIKLLGHAVRMPSGGHTAYVAPHLVPEEHPLAHVEDVYNAVAVRGNAVGEVQFYGRGAGEMPTASACVSDMMEALEPAGPRGGMGWSAETDGFVDPQELCTRFYFRISGSLTDASAAFGQVEVLSEGGETVFLTDCISEAEAQKRSEGLKVLSRMRVLA